MKNYIAYGHRSVSRRVKVGCTRELVPVSVPFKAPVDLDDQGALDDLARAAIAKRYKTAWLVSWGTPDAPAPKLHRLRERGWI